MTELIVAYDRTPKTYEEYLRDEATVLEFLPEVRAIKFGRESINARLRVEGVPTSAAYLMCDAISRRVGGVLVWDDKLLDIGNTMASQIRNMAGKVIAMTVSASVSRAALKKIVKVRDEAAGANPTRRIGLWGVGLLTDFDMVDTACVYGTTDMDGKVLSFARSLIDAGFDGITCSGRGLRVLRDSGLTEHIDTLVLGVRPEGSPTDDHAATITPGEAVRLGASFIGVARPIWNGPGTPLQNILHIKELMARA